MNTTIAFIGAGNMGEALIKGISSNSNYSIAALEVNKERQSYLEKTYPLTIISDYKDLKDYDTIVIAIKPQTISAHFSEIAPYIKKDSAVISIAAGISMRFYRQFLSTNPLIRVMPNTPSLINLGMSGISYSDNCTNEHKQITKDLFNQVGKTLVVPEDKINAVTALSGSGPAYFYSFVDHFATQAASVDIDYNDALLLITQTMLGAAKMIQTQDKSPKELITMVASPGGTTEAALNSLDESTISDIIKKVINSAHSRALELDKQS
jgi:pyrroline-5-carboxylate reductase